MSQIIVEQQSHYTAKMTPNKHFANTIYAKHYVKLEHFFARKIFVVAKIFINSTPAMLEMFQGVLNNYSMLKLRFLINKLTFAMY